MFADNDADYLAPSGASLAPEGSLLRGSMSGVPIPSITGGAGGAAAPSGASASTKQTDFIYNVSGGGNVLFYLAILAGFIAWRVTKK